MGKPKIRFKGYEDAWEQRKVSELLQERNEQAPMSEEYPLMAFIANQGVAPKGDRYDRSALVNDETGKKYKRTEFGDFIYSSNNLETGSIGLNKYGNACISPVYSIFKPTGKADLDFLGRRFLRKDFINEMVKWRQGVVYGQWKIHETDFLNIVVTVPTIEEQKRIGDFLDGLDSLITLHQRKCEETKSLKKYMLQKMFPENGKCVPEIRFSGFSDAWEQRKFGEIVEKYEDLVETPTEGYTRLGIRSHAKGTFHSFVEKGKELETAKMFRVAADKFIVNITFGWEHAVAITDENDAGKLVSHRFPQYSFNAGMVPKFFRYLILDENFKHHLELSSPGGAGRNRVLKLNDMLEYKMNFPSEVEQGKIAAYFDHLDHLITLHQRKCYRFIDIALDAWEQRKLEEYLGVSKEKNRDESFGKDDVLSVSGEYGIVNQIEFQGRSFAGASVANYGVVEGGDVVYTKSPLKSNPYGIIKTNKGKTGIVSTLYAVYKPKNNVGAEFVQIYFELDSRMNSYMHPLVNKGAKNDMKVSDENALKGSVIFPKIDEQKAISKYFAHLDHLITLHQHKCDELQKLKKFMLQNMFV